MEKIKVELSAEDEFYLALGVILNNWYALQVGVNESFRSESLKRKQMEDIFWTAFNGILSYKRHECSWDDVIDYLESSMSMDMDVILEDGSTGAILGDILETYNAILLNSQEEVIQRLKKYKNKWHLLNREEIDFSRLDITQKKEESLSRLPLSINSVQKGTSFEPVPSNSGLSLSEETDDIICSSSSEIIGNRVDNSMETEVIQNVSLRDLASGTLNDEWTTVSRKKFRH